MNTQKTTLFLLLIIFLVACKKETVKVSTKENTGLKADTGKLTKEDTLIKNDSIVVIESQKSIDTLYKFHTELNSEKYKVTVQNLRLTKELYFGNFSLKKKFVTTICEDIKTEGVNFAGHFCFAYWGCGSPCQSSAVVDMKTGIVYDGIPSAVGYQFKKDSKILIVNPPDSTNYYSKNRWVAYPTQYIWTGKKFIEIDNPNRRR